LREGQLFHSRLNPNPLDQLTLPAVAVGYMISGDEGLDANRFFSAERGLDRGRLGTGYQGAAVLFWREELRGVMG
jgi:hypothetical protein